ncbi:MAG: hypothetical protein AABM30_10295 [Actinomycetota bacterium]
MKICALTVRQLKPGSYDEWRQAWWSDAEADEMPEGGEIYIVRNLKNPDEIIAFGLFEGSMEQMEEMMDPETEKKRQEDMAPHVESTGADGLYEVIEHIKAGSTASVGGGAPA